MNELLNKINKKEAIVGIIGLGYVGLPLAVQSAKSGFNVIGFDIQEQKVNKVNKGENYIGDIVSDDLIHLVNNKKIYATIDYSELNKCDIIIICVPTPLDKHMQPDVQYIINSTNEISKYKKKPCLIILESTTYPGTTEEVVKPILDKNDSIIGKDYYLSFSPERIDPGNQDYKTNNIPKIVGGYTNDCLVLTKAFYSSIISGNIFSVSSPKVAEMAKLLENIFRLVNIGLVNEMALLCDAMNIDIWEVIEAAKTKPYGFMPFYPGPGLGGHCIPIDPYYLSWKAKEYNFQTTLIEASGVINQKMPEFVVNKTIKILNNINLCLKKATITILGVAYKKNIDDYRESPVLKIINLLENFGAKLYIIDPFIKHFKDLNNNFRKTDNYNIELLQQSDLVIITTDHSVFNENEILTHSKLIYDTRNFIKKKDQKVIKL